MSYKRRDFLKFSGSLASLILAPLSGNVLSNNIFDLKAKIFGLQLYSLRDVLPQDPKGVLKQVASFGYKQIEGYESASGIFWGMSNTDFKNYMDDLGMELLRVTATSIKILKEKQRRQQR